MFPHHDEHLCCCIVPHENGTYRITILIKNANGEVERELLVSSWCATVELAFEDMTFIQQQRYAQVRGVQPDNRQGWLQSVRRDWQTTQQRRSLGGSSASGGT